MSRPSLCVYKKSSGQDSLAQKMLCALTSGGLATLGFLEPRLGPHLPSGVFWVPGFNWLLHSCPQTQSDAVSIPAALRINLNPFSQSSGPSTTWPPFSPAGTPQGLFYKHAWLFHATVPLHLLCPLPRAPAHTVPPLTEDASSDITSSKRLKCLLPKTPPPNQCILSHLSHHCRPRMAWSLPHLPLGFKLLESQYSTPNPVPGQS